MVDARAAIQEFVALTMLRRRGELPLEDRPKIENLENELRDVIDGARPAPRRIENPTSVAPARVKMNVPPAKVVITQSAPPGDGARARSAGPSVGPAPTVTAAPTTPSPPPSTAIPIEEDLDLASQPEMPAEVTPVEVAAIPVSDLEPELTPLVPHDEREHEEPSLPIRPSGPAKVQLNDKDQSKVKEVAAEEVPPSAYTPSVRPCFLEDYYTADLSAMLVSPWEPVKRVVAAGTDSVELRKEVQVYYGVDNQPAVAPPRLTAPPPAPEPVAPPRAPTAAVAPARERTRTSAAPSAASSQGLPARGATQAAASSGTVPVRAATVGGAGSSGNISARTVQTTVHLLAGGFRRGQLEPFDPSSGFVTFAGGAEQNAPIPLQEVLAIYFGSMTRTTGAPTPAGTRLVVKLVNGREVTGVSQDYAPGVTAMTLVPDDRRGSVEKIWIPAWSVAEIQLG